MSLGRWDFRLIHIQNPIQNITNIKNELYSVILLLNEIKHFDYFI